MLMSTSKYMVTVNICIGVILKDSNVVRINDS